MVWEGNVSALQKPSVLQQPCRQRLRKRGNRNRQSYIYLCTLMVTKADVQAFMAERSEYTKANRFEDIEVKVYI